MRAITIIRTITIIIMAALVVSVGTVWKSLLENLLQGLWHQGHLLKGTAVLVINVVW